MVEEGINNNNIEKSIERLEKLKLYKDLSVIIVCPTRGLIPAKVVKSWMTMAHPVNHMCVGPIFEIGKEIDSAYNNLFEQILTDPLMCQFQYVLTIEEDNLPPPDGLLKLLENMDKYDVVGGLYWSKEENGFPMIFGNPEESKLDFKVQVPKIGEIQRVNGLGMGFTLFKLDIFRKIEYPWFKTIQEYSKEKGSVLLTQDMYFFKKAAEKGYKFAVDNRVKVGHLDYKKDVIY